MWWIQKMQMISMPKLQKVAGLRQEDVHLSCILVFPISFSLGAYFCLHSCCYEHDLYVDVDDIVQKCQPMFSYIYIFRYLRCSLCCIKSEHQNIIISPQIPKKDPDRIPSFVGREFNLTGISYKESMADIVLSSVGKD